MALDDATRDDGPAPSSSQRRRFAIGATTTLPRQLPLALSGSSTKPTKGRGAPAGRCPGKTRRPKKSARNSRMPAPPGPQGQPDELIAAVERAIRARGEELIRHSAGPPTEWLSPTKAGLRYGDVCIAKSDT